MKTVTNSVKQRCLVGSCPMRWICAYERHGLIGLKLVWVWHGWDKGTLTWILGELCTYKVFSPAIDENEYKLYVTSSKAAGKGILALYIVYNSAIACLVILALVYQNYIYGVYVESEWILIWWSSLNLACYCVSLRHCRNCMQLQLVWFTIFQNGNHLEVPRKALMQINQCIGSGRKLYGQPVACSIAVSVGCVSSQCRSCSLVTPP